MQLWYFCCCPSNWILIFSFFTLRLDFEIRKYDIPLDWKNLNISCSSALMCLHGCPTPPLLITHRSLCVYFVHNDCSDFQQHFHQSTHPYILQEGVICNVIAWACNFFPRNFKSHKNIELFLCYPRLPLPSSATQAIKFLPTKKSQPR